MRDVTISRYVEWMLDYLYCLAGGSYFLVAHTQQMTAKLTLIPHVLML